MRHRRTARPAWWLGALAAGLALTVAGCGGRRGEEVYRNEEHGLRLTPPVGWSRRFPCAARGAERPLAAYRRLTADRPAWLEVSFRPAPQGPLAEWLAGRQGGDWKALAAAHDCRCDSQPAARAAWSGRRGRLALLREALAVRRGGRVYLVVATWPAGDEEAAGQARAALASVTWDGQPLPAAR
jgi:hypothetical protein